MVGKKALVSFGQAESNAKGDLRRAVLVGIDMVDKIEEKDKEVEEKKKEVKVKKDESIDIQDIEDNIQRLTIDR